MFTSEYKIKTKISDKEAAKDLAVIESSIGCGHPSSSEGFFSGVIEL